MSKEGSTKPEDVCAMLRALFDEIAEGRIVCLRRTIAVMGKGSPDREIVLHLRHTDEYFKHHEKKA